MASASAIQPQRRRYRYLIVTFGSVAFLVASQFKTLFSLTGIHHKDLENELRTTVPIDSKIQGHQQDIAKNESGDSIGPRVSCDSSPCNGFFAYDGKAVKDILQKAAVAEYNYGRQRNNETHNTMIFMPNTTNHSSCVTEWKESRSKWVDRYEFVSASVYRQEALSRVVYSFV